ncbi:MAG: D-alanine--D-alanine ligase family protein [Acidobacteriota bacterium]
MNTTRIKVGIIFGGMSAEHDVSLDSALAVYTNIDKNKFEPLLIYINRKGEWSFTDSEELKQKKFNNSNPNSFIPWESEFISKSDIDIFFPVLHGPNGEDGKIQGLFELTKKPFAGAGSLPSQLAMDKAVSKILFKEAGLNVSDYLVFSNNFKKDIIKETEKSIGYPCFIKPCSLGSSIGITKAENENELRPGIDLAFKYDNKIIIEKFIKGREIEVSVMGNSEVKISKPGELIPSKEFYDYDDKYLLGKTEFLIPAKLGKTEEEKIKKAAGDAYRSLYLNGFSRVDFFIEKGTEKIIINEINTIPGFTEISMFPKLWKIEGISFTELITILIDYGFEHYKMSSNLSNNL